MAGKFLLLFFILLSSWQTHGITATAADIIAALIKEYKFNIPLKIVIYHDTVLAEVCANLPLPVRKKISILTLGTYDKVPSNLDQLFPNLIAFEARGSLPKKLIPWFKSYKIFSHNNINYGKFNKVQDVPDRAFYEEDYIIENNVITIPEELDQKQFHSLEEICVLSGQEPKIEAYESDDEAQIEDGQLVFRAQQEVFEDPQEESNEQELLLPDNLTDISSLYIPVPYARQKLANNFGTLSFQNTLQFGRREASKSEITSYQKIVEEISLANPIYRDAIKKFFGQIEAIKAEPHAAGPIFIPLPGPPGTGKTYLIELLKSRAGVLIRELKFHMQKGNVTLPLKKCINEIAEPVDVASEKINILFFDEIQNLMSEEEILEKIKPLAGLQAELIKLQDEYKIVEVKKDDEKNRIEYYKAEITRAENRYEEALKNVQEMIAQKKETYCMLQEIFGTGYFSKTTKRTVLAYVQEFIDNGTEIILAKKKKDEIVSSNQEMAQAKEVSQANFEQLLLNSEDDINAKNHKKKLEEIEKKLEKNNQELLEIEKKITIIKTTLINLTQELLEDYPRLIGEYTALKEPALIINQFIKTPVKFIKLMQEQAQITPSQSKWSLNKTIIFLAVNNHALIARVNNKFKSGGKMNPNIDPQEYRNVYEEFIDNKELQQMILSRFTYYDAESALKEFLGQEIEEIQEETSIDSRLNLENFEEKLPPGKDEWRSIILEQLKIKEKNIALDIAEAGVGVLRAIKDEDGQINAQEERGHEIPFKMSFEEELIDFIYKKCAGILGFRTFKPRFNELFQGFDAALKLELFARQNQYEEDFLQAAYEYMHSHKECRNAHTAQRKMYGLKNLVVAFRDKAGNPLLEVISKYNDESGNEIHAKILQYPIVFEEQGKAIKELAPAKDYLPVANEIAAMLVLGMNNFLSRPKPGIEFGDHCIEPDFILKLWPNRSVANYSYEYRKIMTYMATLAVAAKLNINVRKKYNPTYQNFLEKSIKELRQYINSQERQLNFPQKEKLPLHKVIGDELSKIKFFQKIYDPTIEDSEIMQYLLDNADLFVGFYDNIINAIAQRIVDKKAQKEPLAFSNLELYELVNSYWPSIDYTKQKKWHHILNWFFGWDIVAINFDSAQALNVKIKNDLLFCEEGCPNILLCKNENLNPVILETPLSLAEKIAKTLGKVGKKEYQRVSPKFSSDEHYKNGFAPINLDANPTHLD